MDWGNKWLVDFNAGEPQLVSLDWSNNTGVIDVKIYGSVIEERGWQGFTFSSKLDYGSYIISIAKTAFKKIGDLICSMKFIFPGAALYCYTSTIHAWNTVVMPGLLLLAATWNCLSYKNGHVGP